MAPAIIHQRTDFASSMIDGRTVMELDPASSSSDEITLLWQYLHGRIARVPGRMAAQQAGAGTPPPGQEPGRQEIA